MDHPLVLHIPLHVVENDFITFKRISVIVKVPLKVIEDEPINLKVLKEEPIKIKVVDEEPIKLRVIDNSGPVYPIYTGETRITPKVRQETELDTDRKIVLDKIVVLEIPYYETSNVKGTTFIVGGN